MQCLEGKKTEKKEKKDLECIMYLFQFVQFGENKRNY